MPSSHIPRQWRFYLMCIFQPSLWCVQIRLPSHPHFGLKVTSHWPVLPVLGLLLHISWISTLCPGKGYHKWRPVPHGPQVHGVLPGADKPGNKVLLQTHNCHWLLLLLGHQKVCKTSFCCGWTSEKEQEKLSPSDVRRNRRRGQESWKGSLKEGKERWKLSCLAKFYQLTWIES